MKRIFFLVLLGIVFYNNGLRAERGMLPPFRSGKDFALFFANNDYDYWVDLANPIADVEAIAHDLRDLYGFETEIVQNAEKRAILDKIEAYRRKTYDEDAQLLVFFSGHGEFNESARQGFFVPKGGLLQDEYGESFIEYEFLKRRLASLPCNHILLMLDACFSGTADEGIAMRGEPGRRPGVNAASERMRYISSALQYKSRIMLTSGAKERTPDKSQFVAKFLEALRARGGHFGLINTPELFGYLTTAVPKPMVSSFGDNVPGAEFLFVLQGDSLMEEVALSGNIEKDLAAWSVALDSNTLDAYRVYMSRFPNGAFRGQAQDFIREGVAWQAAADTNTVISYLNYLQQFGKGQHAVEAGKRILVLDPTLKRDEVEKPRIIKGVVTDTKGEALIGVLVSAVGASTVTMTDIFGCYQIVMPRGSNKLRFSLKKYRDQEIEMGVSNATDVVLSKK